MRALSVIALAALTVACSPREELRFTSTLDAEVDSLRLTADGLDAVAAMAGTTCTIDTNWGCPVADVDLPTDREHIVDLFDGETVATSTEGVHVIRDERWVKDEDVPLADVWTAGRSGGDLVVVSGTEDGCALWIGGSTLVVDGAACADGLTYSLDRANGRVFAAGNGQVLALTAQGSAVVTDRHDLAAWDAGTGSLFVALRGGFEVTRMDAAGHVAWTAPLDGPVSAIAARGSLGQAVVLSETTDGYGLVERFAGEDGERLGHGRVPDPDRTLEVSDNGIKLAMISEGEVHFYELGGDLEAAPVDPTPVTCIVPTQTRRVRD